MVHCLVFNIPVNRIGCTVISTISVAYNHLPSLHLITYAVYEVWPLHRWTCSLHCQHYFFSHIQACPLFEAYMLGVMCVRNRAIRNSKNTIRRGKNKVSAGEGEQRRRKIKIYSGSGESHGVPVPNI